MISYLLYDNIYTSLIIANCRCIQHANNAGMSMFVLLYPHDIPLRMHTSKSHQEAQIKKDYCFYKRMLDV